MEKVVYALWAGRDGRDALNQRLIGEVAGALAARPEVRGVRVNVQDAAVAPAEPLRQVSTRPQMDAALQLWVDNATDAFRRPLDDLVAGACERMAAWLVTESQAIRNTRHPPQPGQRTEGWSQLVFLTRPPRLRQPEWLDVWQRLHTVVGIETQSNFEYVQNVVVRALTYAAPPYDAIVEECFPTAAMTDPHAFFAAGDEATFKANLDRMMESCARFIDFDKIDVLPTSQHVVKDWQR